MSMQAEWKDRIRQWKNELKRLFYREMDEITFEGFLTSEFLPFEQACQHQRSPFPAGTRWGKAFEYGWLFGEYRVPETAAGKKLVLNLGFGTEGTVFVNGEAFGPIVQIGCAILINICAIWFCQIRLLQARYFKLHLKHMQDTGIGRL